MRTDRLAWLQSLNVIRATKSMPKVAQTGWAVLLSVHGHGVFRLCPVLISLTSSSVGDVRHIILTIPQSFAILFGDVVLQISISFRFCGRIFGFGRVVLVLQKQICIFNSLSAGRRAPRPQRLDLCGISCGRQGCDHGKGPE